MAQNVVGSCDVYPSSLAALREKLLWINTLIIALSLIDIVLLLKAAVRSILLMRRLRAWAKDQAGRLLKAAGVQSHDAPRFGSDGDDMDAHDAPLLKEDHLASPLGDRKNREQTHKVVFSFENTFHADASGDIFVKADIANKSGRRSIVFAPGDSTQSVFEDVDDNGDVRAVGEASSSQDDRDNRLQMAAAAAKALQTAWANMSWRDRLRFINGWAVLALAADLCNIASGCLCLIGQLASLPTDTNHALLMGCGVMFLWVGAVRFLEHDRCE